jgi:predicted Rossmann fold flavoprotein
MSSTLPLIVVGAGPAGLMAAIHAQTPGTLVLEQQPWVGARLCMSAMGTAAISNADVSVEHFHGRHARFVSDALAALPLTALLEWFHRRGVPVSEAPFYGLMVPEGGGAELLECMLDELASAGAELRTEAEVVAVAHDGEAFQLELAHGEVLRARRLVLATGAGNMPQLGTSRRGYELAGALGHGVTPVLPAQVPVTVRQTWAMRTSGCWMDVSAALLSGGREVAATEGSVLFTHSGLTGEAVFNLSGEVAPRMLAGEALTLELNFHPDLTRDEVAEWMHRVLGERTRERAVRALDHMVPAPLVRAMLHDLKVKPHARAMHLERPQRDTLLEWFTAARLQVTGVLDARAAEAVTGGVPVREVNPRTMESRCTPGLYVAGGMLDVRADWGGHGQHFAFASGLLAGEAVREGREAPGAN